MRLSKSALFGSITSTSSPDEKASNQVEPDRLFDDPDVSAEAVFDGLGARRS